MLSNKEFESVKKIEQQLAALRGIPPAFKLIEGPRLILLAEPVAFPAANRRDYECELLVANAGSETTCLDAIQSSLTTVTIRSRDLPATLAPHSPGRRLHLKFSGEALAQMPVIPLTLLSGDGAMGQFSVRVAAPPAEKRPPVLLSESIHFSKDAEIEIFPAALDFGRVPFWNDVRLQTHAPGAERVEAIGDLAPEGPLPLWATKENPAEWACVASLPNGEYRYYFKINGCRTLDSGAAHKLLVGPDGIFSCREICHDTRYLTLRNHASKRAAVKITAAEDWIVATPGEVKIEAQQTATIAVKIVKEKMALGDFTGQLEIAAGRETARVPLAGALFAEGKTAFISGGFTNGVFKAGKCFVGRPLAIPLKITTLGHAAIRLYAFDSVSGLMQQQEIVVDEPNRLREVDCTLQIPTDFLLPQQQTFRLRIETNCYLANLAGHSFEVECEPVYLLPQPRVLDFVFAKKEARHLQFLSVHRSDHESMRLRWRLSPNLAPALKINQEGPHRLRIEASGAALPPADELEGDLIVEDADSGTQETIPCWLRLHTVKQGMFTTADEV